LAGLCPFKDYLLGTAEKVITTLRYIRIRIYFVYFEQLFYNIIISLIEYEEVAANVEAHKNVPYGFSSGSGNFQNNQNLDFQNSRSDKNHSKSQILSSENPSPGYFENYQN
jgi:hypothetical protein